MAIPHNTNGTSNGSDRIRKETDPLWVHPAPKSTPMWAFLQHVNGKHGVQLQTYKDLHQWSVDNISAFWGEVWHYVGIKASKPYLEVVDEKAPMFPRPTFFKGAELNFAENLLFPPSNPNPDDLAIIAATETGRENVTWKQLRERVRRCQAGLTAAGVKEGDRIAGYVANHPNAVVAMLASASLGALWTAVSPDTGVHAVLERLRQIEPVVLFADNFSLYNGKTHPVLPKVAEIAASLPTLKNLVIFPIVGGDDEAVLQSTPLDSVKCDRHEDFISVASPEGDLEFAQLPPDHPVYILYSSGTTGAPKCIVHGNIGTLIQHKKEHILQSSIGPGSRLFYFTTCTWMMWHWLVSGLASGATLVLYDGSPFRYKSKAEPPSSVPDDLAMPRLIEELGITHFGTSAKYLSVLEQKFLTDLKNDLNLSTLQAIYSTGSPLSPSTFKYVYRAFPSSINLGSITGGTDIISLFGAPSPLSPVYAGEIQVPGLGMAIRAYEYTGKDVTDTGEAGDLVCVRPFPCQPVMFWGSDGHAKYRGSYFDKFEGLDVWHHGDFVRFNPRTGGLVMLGRSDGILKPAGVRFGSAEIYNVLLKHFPEEVADALCIGRRRETDTDETVVLFLKMAEGKKIGDGDLVERIKAVIRKELSARHVPGIMDECPEIPVTTNGKKVEGAVKQILCGLNVKTSASVANAECLDWYRHWSETHQ
ncbi:acetoacetate-CoA ligase [Saccharata proteae CBS 121410]|uniref:Acetoacetate-CoA ligase n=1 Tax=Saccharata proteae CBS 121410 TaxID=1314787 RepID=A0A9P4HZ21_9PEZI|nr:acetoacetate-CoA ligase [Saccharata proteae CBS 121410]